MSSLICMIIAHSLYLLYIFYLGDMIKLLINPGIIIVSDIHILNARGISI